LYQKSSLDETDIIMILYYIR